MLLRVASKQRRVFLICTVMFAASSALRECFSRGIAEFEIPSPHAGLVATIEPESGGKGNES